MSASVKVERVVFDSAGEALVGHYYRPENLTGKAPVVLVTGAWTTIKEQMAGSYARRLAEAGCSALAFDFRTWGESGGTSRSLEDPEMKIEDILAAASAMKARKDVSEVYGLGICASAGYMATACERTEDISKLALVAAWLHDREIVLSVYGGEEGVEQLILKGREAAASEKRSGQPVLIPAAGPEGSEALMPFEGYYTDPKRGGLDQWENTFNVASWEAWLSFDAQRAAPRMKQPTLLVHSEAAAIPGGVKSFYSALTGAKRQVWLRDVTQFDFYDQEKAVEASLAAVLDHFQSKIADPDEAAVKTTMRLIGELVDRGDYEALGRIFADQLVIDYSSLWGGESSTMAREDVIEAWSKLVPGFDRTYHDLTLSKVTVTGSTAEVEADIVATHWLNDETWLVAGRYKDHFKKDPETKEWHVTRIEFILEREEGERSLVERAQRKLASELKA